MAEFDCRSAHHRTYRTPDDRLIAVIANERGVVEITEEALNQILQMAGCIEITGQETDL